jgi:tripartite-type tricarboxylate transporter receptor subunit TctC
MTPSSNPCPAQRRQFLRAGAAGLAGLLGPTRGHAAAATGGEVMHLLCSGPAGSIPDIMARAVAEQLLASSGRRAIVDNRPGAAGQISVAAMKAAPADGTTLLLAQGAIATVYPALYTRLAYDPVLDLQPVSLAGEMSLGLAVGPAVPAEVTTLAHFIAWLRNNPASANIGSPGTGTLPHLLAAMLFRAEGVAWQHVAYAGGPPAVNDLLGGQIAGLVLPEGLLRQHHATRRLRVLASSGAVRSTYMPDAPSFAEQGRPELVLQEWFGFFAAGRVPKAAVAAASSLLQDAIARPALAAVFAQAGLTPASSSPALLSERIAREQPYWQGVLRANGIQAD